jgi:hypothetical protein
MLFAVTGVVGAKLGRLLGKENAKQLVAQINGNSASATPALSNALKALLGRKDAESIFTAMGDASSIQPKVVRKLVVLLGQYDAQSLIASIELGP